MEKQKLLLTGMLLLGTPLMAGSLYAATAIDLSHQPASILKSFTPNTLSAATKGTNVQEIRRNIDFKKTTHIRMQQTYLGYPVWGGEAIVHVPQNANTMAGVAKNNTSIDGTFYQGINEDLATAPNVVFTAEQANKALNEVIRVVKQEKNVKYDLTHQQSHLMVYIDDAGKAHWAYRVSFYIKELPSAPVYIVDALSMNVYQSWNEVKTLDDVDGGGFGGNKKMGEVDYDGQANDLAKLSVERDASTSICYLENADVTVRNYDESGTNPIASFSCSQTNPEHNAVYWDGAADSVNGGYSPQNDALFSGQVVKRMFWDWYKVHVLTEDGKPDGKPLMLTMIVHGKICDWFSCTKENAAWDPETSTMTFGDGEDTFYPLTSLGVGAHEVSHGFTQQHSNLLYSGQSGGMNESFSDMAAQAAEFYAYGKNSWEIGPEIFKKEGEALRYMDQPSKDGKSIDDASQYKSSLNVHYTSGVYNRLFYLMGTAPGSDAHKAFDVMVQAQNYWTANATYKTAACGVLKAAADVGFSVDVVKSALTTVKINYSKC